MTGRCQSLALKIALCYAVLAILWIAATRLPVFRAAFPGGQWLNLTIPGLVLAFILALVLFLVLRPLLRSEVESRIKAEKLVHQLTEAVQASELSVEIFYKRDLQNRLVYVSSQSLEVLGYTPAELGDWTRLLTDHPTNQQAMAATRRAVETGQRQPPYLLEVRHKNGRAVMLEVHEGPVRDSAGNVVGVAGSARDVTEREAAQAAWKRSEEQLRLLNQVYALVSHINEAIVRNTDRDVLLREVCRITVELGHFEFASIALRDPEGRLQPVGFAGEAAASDVADPVPTRLTRVALENGKVALHRREAEDWEPAASRFACGTGIPLKLREAAIGVFCVCSTQAGALTTVVLESLIEVASDLGFALELFERNREREQERQLLRLQNSALQAAANAIVITDREGQIEWVNEAFTRLTGYLPEEALGSLPALLRSGLHDDRFYGEMWQTVLSGKVWQGVLTNKRKDGTVYHEEMTITPVRDRNAHISHFIAIKQDITERRRLEQQFLRAQRMQSIGLLAGGIAHDLNNVLAPVLMAVPLLKTNLAPDQRAQVLETLEQSVRRGANIVQQVLAFARGVEVQRSLLQARHLLREVARIAEETFPRDITIQTTIAPDLWLMQADPTQIHQVLLNLAVNARDAMPNGGTLRISALNLELAEPMAALDFELLPGRYVAISVADTGSGIKPELLERIFEPFFTTKPAGRGTGLGLSTVLGILKSHGGLIEVKSQPGSGSTFTVYLPAAPQDHLPAAVPSSPRTPSSGSGRQILLVDDEPALLELMRATCETAGYRVLLAADGVEGLARFAEHADTIEAIVTDLMMPRMGGVDFVKALRRVHRNVPIIVITGLMQMPGELDRSGELRDAGVEHFLAKPFHSQELLAKLESVLARSAA